MQKLPELDRQFSPFDDLFLEDMHFITYHINVEIPVPTSYSFLKSYWFAELIWFFFFYWIHKLLLYYQYSHKPLGITSFIFIGISTDTWLLDYVVISSTGPRKSNLILQEWHNS